MNTARTSLFLHLLSACALMAYTVVACTVTPAAGEDREPTTKSIVDDAAESTVQDPGMGRPVK